MVRSADWAGPIVGRTLHGVLGLWRRETWDSRCRRPKSKGVVERSIARAIDVTNAGDIRLRAGVLEAGKSLARESSLLRSRGRSLHYQPPEQILGKDRGYFPLELHADMQVPGQYGFFNGRNAQGRRHHAMIVREQYAYSRPSITPCENVLPMTDL